MLRMSASFLTGCGTTGLQMTRKASSAAARQCPGSCVSLGRLRHRRQCADKRLQLNEGKTEVLWFGTAANLRKISPDVSSIRVGSTVVTPTTVVCNLGVMLDAKQGCRCASTCPGQRSHAFTTFLSVGNLAVISLPNWCLCLS